MYELASVFFTYLPNRQGVHPVALDTLLNESMGQFVQEAAPVDAAKVPCGHSLQTDAPEFDVFPAAQLVHEAVAMAALYVPLAHEMHDDAAAPENVPAGHTEHDVARPRL